MAPSAAATEVLSDELGFDCENTAKWLHEHRRNRQRQEQLAEVQCRLRGDTMARLCERADRLSNEIDRWGLRRGQLVMVDESSVAGTFALDEHAAIAGCSAAAWPLPQQGWSLT